MITGGRIYTGVKGERKNPWDIVFVENGVQYVTSREMSVEAHEKPIGWD